MNIKFKSLVDTFNIEKTKASYKYTSRLIEAIIFNMIAICYAITAMNNNKKIKKDDIYIVKDFIIEKLKLKYFNGGSVLPTSYFNSGGDTMYNVGNEGGNLLNVDFDGGFVRPQIGGGGGGGKGVGNSDIKDYMKDLIIDFDIIVSKNIINELTKLVHLILFLVFKEVNKAANNDDKIMLIKDKIRKLVY